MNSFSKCSICNTSTSFWSRTRECHICKRKTCKKCMIADDCSLLFKIQGICIRCHKILINHPSFSLLPTDSDFSETVTKCISIIESDPFQDFDLISILGSGNFSQVFHVQSKKTLQSFALKQLDPNRYTQAQVNQEIIQSVLSPHPKLLNNFALYNKNGSYYILQELMHSTIRNFILMNEIVPEDICLYILKQVLKGLKYLHENFRIHRDIKSDNLFITFNSDIKIGDFLSLAQLTQERDLRSTLIGTPLYLAPEIIEGDTYGTEVDIWALGVLAYELVFKDPIFADSKGFSQLFQRISEFSVKDLTSSEYEKVDKIVKMCLVRDKKRRVSCEELLENEVFLVNEDACREFLKGYVNG